jgi:hypothetical protein
MYLAICCLTVLTAAGDEQFEESPEQCETRENSHLNPVIDQMVKWKKNIKTTLQKSH